MSLTVFQYEAIFALYPQVVTIRDNVAYDADGNEVQYDTEVVNLEADKLSCKATAQQLLQTTDWTQAADCPLVNKAEFTAYRATVRELAINPVANPTFPELPTEQW